METLAYTLFSCKSHRTGKYCSGPIISVFRTILQTNFMYLKDYKMMIFQWRYCNTRCITVRKAVSNLYIHEDLILQ
jgi:hypothetical protein